MKFFLTLAAAAIFLFTTTCNNNTKSNSMEISGTIEPIGMTTWQYGSHTITNDDGILYALRSEKLKLENYEGRRVTLKGDKVEGYPVENGPEFIEVIEIKE